MVRNLYWNIQMKYCEKNIVFLCEILLLNKNSLKYDIKNKLYIKNYEIDLEIENFAIISGIIYLLLA